MKPFTVMAIVLFALISLVHLLRLILGWEMTINSVAIPMWISPPALIIAAFLAFMLWREMKK